MPNRKICYVFALAVLLLTSLVAPNLPKAYADSNVNVFFLGAKDDNGDGVANTKDRSRLFASLHGASVVQISGDDENVTAFDVSTDMTKAAYTVANAGKVTLQIVTIQSKSTTKVDLPDLTAADKVRYFPNMVWVVGINSKKKPVIMGVDPAQGKVTAQHAMRLDDTEIFVHPAGNYVLAYSNSGALGVFHMPDLKQVDLGLTGYGASIPLWSPTAERFVVVSAPKEKPANLDVTLVDVAGKPKVTRVAVPHYEKKTKTRAVWSDYGRYVVFSASNYDVKTGAQLDSKAFLVDTTNNSVSPLDYQGQMLTLLAWAPNDAAVVALAQPTGTADTAPSFVIYDTTSKQFTPLKAPATVQFSSVRWSPVNPTLGLVGLAPTLNQYGVFMGKSPAYDVSNWVLVTNDQSLAQSILFWTPDGSQMILVNAATLTKDKSGKVTASNGAVYVVDISNGSVSRISPEDVAINSIGLEIR